MIGEVRGRLNSVYGSRLIRHYFRQSAGRGFFMMGEKVLRGRGKGVLFVGSYALFLKDYDTFVNRTLNNWRKQGLRPTERWKQTIGALRLRGGEIRSNYGKPGN